MAALNASLKTEPDFEKIDLEDFEPLGKEERMLKINFIFCQNPQK